MDKSGADKTAIDEMSSEREMPIVVRQFAYLNKAIEQDRRAIKRATKPMLDFKSFQSAKNVLAGIEFMHMIRSPCQKF
jgi:putative transposase